MGCIRDDLPLLELLIERQFQTQTLYRPTLYWRNYWDETVRFLRAEGLRGYRASQKGHLASFGAADFSPVRAQHRALNDAAKVGVIPAGMLDSAIKTIDLIFENDLAALPYGLNRQMLNEMLVRTIDLAAVGRGVPLLSSISADLSGGPEFYFTVLKNSYTTNFIIKYWRYLNSSRFIDWSEVKNFVEIGPGAGTQAEVIRKCHPDINCYLFDLAPQAYVCTQALKATFGDAVMDYRGHCGSGPIGSAGQGEIFVGLNSDLERLKTTGETVFWNAAAFAEMEPAVVQHYLRLGAPLSDIVFMFQDMAGKATSTEASSKLCVNERTLFEHYDEVLSVGHKLVHRQPHIHFHGNVFWQGSAMYEDACWTRKNGSSKAVRSPTGPPLFPH